MFTDWLYVFAAFCFTTALMLAYDEYCCASQDQPGVPGKRAALAAFTQGTGARIADRRIDGA
jgi:hypothetical protein